MSKQQKQMTAEVTVKMRLNVNTHPRKWFANCFAEWMENVLDVDEDLVSYEVDIKESNKQNKNGDTNEKPSV